MQNFIESLKTGLRNTLLSFRQVASRIKSKCKFFKAKEVSFNEDVQQEGIQNEVYSQSQSDSLHHGTGDTHNKRNLFMIASVLVVLIGVVATSFYFLRSDKQGTELNKKSEIFSLINKGEIVGTFKVGEKARFGDLQISLHNIVEDSYRTLETDFNGERMTKAYLGAQIEAFNMSNNTNDVLFFGLIDENGNQYERDREIEFYLGSTKDFGIAKEMYPRTIREGYLLFPAPDSDAKNLQLIVYSEVRNEKIIFEIER